MTLDSGEKFEYEVPYETIKELKEKGITKVKAIIRDTHGKSHYSSWYEI